MHTRTRRALAPVLALLVVPLALSGDALALGHYYGDGHAELAWTTSFFPPSVDGAGAGHLSTNLAAFGEAMVFGLPLTLVELSVAPAAAPNPVTGTMELLVPAAADPWWATYGAPVPHGITTGGTVTFALTGYAEHHANAVTLFGTFAVTGATGQYVGLVSSGDFSGSSTGGGGSAGFGRYFDFAVIGQYA